MQQHQEGLAVITGGYKDPMLHMRISTGMYLGNTNNSSSVVVGYFSKVRVPASCRPASFMCVPIHMYLVRNAYVETQYQASNNAAVGRVLVRD